MKILCNGVLCVALLGSVVASQAQTQFPLRVDIDVSTKRSMRNIGAGRDGEAKVEVVQVIVKIHKASGQPWDDPINAELYVIGRQIHSGYYGIIDVQKGSGTFGQENDNSFYYRSPKYSIGRTKGNINVGGTYETFLVVITDHEGNVITTRSGRSIGKEGIAFIRELKKQTLFDRDGNVVGKLKNPNAAFKKAVPAAVRSGRHH